MILINFKKQLKINTIYINKEINIDKILDEYNLTMEFLRNLGPVLI